MASETNGLKDVVVRNSAAEKMPMTVPKAHSCGTAATGLAIITIGNTLRKDDGIATVVCDLLPAHLRVATCRFDLGLHTGYILECMTGHRVAIIIDAMRNGAEAGTVALIEISNLKTAADSLRITSCHGISWMDELRLFARHEDLPSTILFFGVEIGSSEGEEGITSNLQENLPFIVRKLSCLIGGMQTKLNRHA